MLFGKLTEHDFRIIFTYFANLVVNVVCENIPQMLDVGNEFLPGTLPGRNSKHIAKQSLSSPQVQRKQHSYKKLRASTK